MSVIDRLQGTDGFSKYISGEDIGAVEAIYAAQLREGHLVQMSDGENQYYWVVANSFGSTRKGIMWRLPIQGYPSTSDKLPFEATLDTMSTNNELSNGEQTTFAVSHDERRELVVDVEGQIAVLDYGTPDLAMAAASAEIGLDVA